MFINVVPSGQSTVSSANTRELKNNIIIYIMFFISYNNIFWTLYTPLIYYQCGHELFLLYCNLCSFFFLTRNYPFSNEKFIRLTLLFLMHPITYFLFYVLHHKILCSISQNILILITKTDFAIKMLFNEKRNNMNHILL